MSRKSQKERNPDDIVDTKTVTDMSETINRDHSEECEKKRKTCDDLVDTDAGTDTDMSENNSRDQAKHHDRPRQDHFWKYDPSIHPKCCNHYNHQY